MHSAVATFVDQFRPADVGSVLDVGGRDVNGSVRRFFGDADWLSVDLMDGPDVDIVGDITEVEFERQLDVVLSLEVLEHAENWAGIVAACADACADGGTVLVTCAGPGRGEHSAVDGGALRAGEWYRNVDCDELRAALESAGLVVAVCRQVGEDTQAMARRV